MANDVLPEAVEDKKPWALKALPPFPAVALQLLSLLDNPEVPLKKIVDLLRMDPALSAELLRVANSALYGFVQQIDTVKHAVIVLGSENVKRLALTVALGKFSKGFLRYENLRVCWNHVMASAMIAEELAVSLNLSKDRAYTAGLLHDVGRLALLVSYPVEYGNLLAVARQENFDQLECERELFDIDHCAAGQWLAQHWNLPADYGHAIAKHHSLGPYDGVLTHLVTCSCRLADCLGYGVLQMPPTETVSQVLAELPLRDPVQAEADLTSATERINNAIQTIAPATA
jgi:putative nucleotidyltransferase with HDIG domain